LTVAKSAYPKDGFFLRAESFFNVATNVETIGVSGYGGASLHEQSHGESLMALFSNRFRGNGLYILDEPEAGLSPTRQLALLLRMSELVSQNSQFIIATHSPILLAYPNAQIFQLSEADVRQVAYEETELYFLYEQFIKSPKRMLDHLL
jgi:predicted ATPase